MVLQTLKPAPKPNERRSATASPSGRAPRRADCDRDARRRALLANAFGVGCSDFLGGYSLEHFELCPLSTVQHLPDRYTNRNSDHADQDVNRAMLPDKSDRRQSQDRSEERR